MKLSHLQRYSLRHSIALLGLLLVLAACDAGMDADRTASVDASSDSASSERGIISDEQIKARVQVAIARQADLPQQIEVEVKSGIVSISGSLACETCGGLRTPGNLATVQQSLGAVIRAVTGVSRVIFDLSSET